MKAVLFEAEYAPKKDYHISDRERETRRIRSGNMVWRNPKIRVVDLPVPVPKDDEILLRVKACGWCGSDVHIYEVGEDEYTKYPAYLKSPVILGHEFSGVVEHVGRGVSLLAPGDMVTSTEQMWCGECNSCRAGLFNQCERKEDYGFTENGAMAEYMAVRAKYCYKIDRLAEAYGNDDKAFEAGAMVEPASVAYNALFIESGGMRPGAHVAVFGTGPIGLFSVALARAAGAASIVGFEVSEKRARLAEQLGADAVYDPVKLEAEGRSTADVILEHTHGSGANLMVEAAGVPQSVLPGATRALAADGKFVQVGRAAAPVYVNLEDLIRRGATLHGSLGHSGEGIFPMVIRLMAAKRIDLLPAITGRYSLEEAPEGFERLCRREDAKLMIRM